MEFHAICELNSSMPTSNTGNMSNMSLTDRLAALSRQHSNDSLRQEGNDIRTGVSHDARGLHGNSSGRTKLYF